jgi:hypothetical protein
VEAHEGSSLSRTPSPSTYAGVGCEHIMRSSCVPSGCLRQELHAAG